MSRKNLYQLFEERELTPEYAFNLLYDFFVNRKVKISNSEHISMYDFTSRFLFKNTPKSIEYRNFDDFMNSRNLNPKNKINYNLDDVFLLIEVIYYLGRYTDELALTIPEIAKFYEDIDGKIKYILDKTNHQIIVNNKNNSIVVPINYATDQAVMLVMNKNEDIAYEFYKYKHFSNFGKLEEKRKILTTIANYYDKKLSGTTAGNLVNNFNIRHNNKEGINKNDYIQNMCGEELEKWYDRIFNELIYFVIEKEHKKTEKLLNEIQAKDKE